MTTQSPNGPEQVAQSRPKKSLARTAPTSKTEAEPLLMVQQVRDGAAAPRGTSVTQRDSRAPRVYVSVFGPSATRRRAWFTGRCGKCGAHVFGAVAGLEIFPVRRRLACGHRAIVFPARIYYSPGGLGGGA